MTWLNCSIHCICLSSMLCDKCTYTHWCRKFVIRANFLEYDYYYVLLLLLYWVHYCSLWFALECTCRKNYLIDTSGNLLLFYSLFFQFFIFFILSTRSLDRHDCFSLYEFAFTSQFTQGGQQQQQQQQKQLRSKVKWIRAKTSSRDLFFQCVMFTWDTEIYRYINIIYIKIGINIHWERKRHRQRHKWKKNTHR